MESNFYAALKNVVTKHVNFKTVLGFSISAILLWLTFYNSGLHLKDVRLNGEQVYYFAAAIVVFIFSVWFYSVRAKLFWINSQKNQTSIHAYDSLILGNFYNCLLPGNLGEAVRAWHFSRKNKVTFSRSLAAIIAEKWIDAQMFVALAILLYLFKPFVSHYILYSIFLTASIVVLLSATYTFLRRNNAAERKIWRLIFRLQKTGRVLYRLYSHTGTHIDGIKTNRCITKYVFLCCIVFFLNLLQFFFLLKAAGVAEPVCSFYTAFLVVASMMIIAFVPSAPSNIGVLHYGLYSALILAAYQYGLSPDNKSLQSFALFGIYVHLSYIIPEVLLGTLFVIKERKIIF